jgi:surface protein
MSQILENKKSKMISLDILNKVSKSICKLKCKNGDKEWTGTGFFMSITFENKVLINCLITNYNIIAQHISNNNIQLQIGDNKKTFNIGKERHIKYFKKPTDITMIEILKEDEFIKEVNFLSYDLIYIKFGYKYYLDKEIFIIQHPYGKEIHSANGKIICIKNVEFEHDAGTSSGSSGLPVILIENNCVIGIHKGIKKNSDIKIGTFLDKLFGKKIINSKIQKRIKDIQIQISVEESNKIENEEPQKITNISDSLSQENDNELSNDKNNQENTDKNLLTLQYAIQKNKSNVILFSKEFLKFNHINKLDMLINNERKMLCHQMDISKKKIKNNILEIKLIKLNEVISFENMFKGTDLMSISGFSNFDSKELTDISNMFSGCKNLISIIDIDFLNTNNVKKMNHMFYNCKSLESLPDLSKWNTSNVTHIDYMFEGCEKLKSLPDISKWSTSNVIQMKHMFSNCKSLISLPDISKWDISNVKDISYLFSNCESLSSIPDIQKWSSKNLKNIFCLFSGCKSLTSDPDIFKWKTQEIKNKNKLSNGCKNSNKLPKIPK